MLAASMSLASPRYKAEDSRCVDSQASDLPGNTYQNKASSDKAVPEMGAPVCPEEQVPRAWWGPPPGLPAMVYTVDGHSLSGP